MNNCTECGTPSGDYPLCIDCRHEQAEYFEHVCGGYVIDDSEFKLFEETNTPEQEECQAWIVVDGQRVTPDDVRRLANMLQKTRWAWIVAGFELNKKDQMIRRLEYELGDCGYAPTYSITPKGYDLFRDMAI